MKILGQGESLSIGEFNFTVSHTPVGYYLTCTSGSYNEAVFTKNDIDELELQMKILGYKDGRGAFPYCKTLEDLTKFVAAIEEKVPLKRTKGTGFELKPIILKLLSPDYTIDLSSEKIKKEGRLNTFLLLNL